MSRGAFFYYLPQACIDIADIAEYIANDNTKTALDFTRAVADTCQTLAEMPEMGVARDYNNLELNRIRMMPVNRYPNHLIFYVARSSRTGVDVLRILHSARDLPLLFA